MFNIFKKNKSNVEKLIEKNGFKQTTDDASIIIIKALKTKALALQFCLEEIEAASRGNDESIKFASESGFTASEYQGAMNNSSPEIDGPGGPQQFILQITSQINHDVGLMVNFRTTIVDNIMIQFDLGKYSSSEDHHIQGDEVTTNYVDTLIKWAENLNLPSRKLVNQEGFSDRQIYEGFPSDEKSLLTFGNMDRFVRGSVYDSSKTFDLDMNDYGISSLPKEFFRLVGVHVLYLRRNNLKELPDEIGCLTNIYRLDLGENSIEDIPETVCNLARLEYLNLYDNNIRLLPECLMDMPNLNSLNLANNSNLSLSDEQKIWIDSFEGDIWVDDDLLNRDYIPF